MTALDLAAAQRRRAPSADGGIHHRLPEAAQRESPPGPRDGRPRRQKARRLRCDRYSVDEGGTQTLCAVAQGTIATIESGET